MSSPHAPQFLRATLADVPLIQGIVRAAYSGWVPVIGREPRPMNADYKKAVVEHRIDLLAVEAEVVGLVETTLRDDHLWIENVAVSPPQQGNGYGKMLLAHAERLAHEAGRTQTRLLTNAAFETNVRLYQRIGYVVTSSEPFMGGTTLYMSKILG